MDTPTEKQLTPEKPVRSQGWTIDGDYVVRVDNEETEKARWREIRGLDPAM